MIVFGKKMIVFGTVIVFSAEDDRFGIAGQLVSITWAGLVAAGVNHPDRPGPAGVNQPGLARGSWCQSPGPVPTTQRFRNDRIQS